MKRQEEPELYLELDDTQWDLTYTDHDRPIARAVVYDEEGFLYFVRAYRDDEFGKAELIETSGGGIEEGEDPETAIHRELKEELGAEVDVVCRIGTVSDYYHLIHRHNINHYFLCKVISFGETNMTEDEKKCFRLSRLKLTFREAFAEYERCAVTKIGRLIANRELPVLKRAQELLEELNQVSQ